MIHDEDSVVKADFPSPRAARAFADYLASVGVPVRVMDRPDRSTVILDDAGHRQRFIEELHRFAADPGHQRYREASWQAGASHQADSAPLGAWYRRRGAPLRLSRAGPVTILVAVACVATFLAMALDDPFNLWATLRFFTRWSAVTESTEFWRWLTPSLVHLGIMHIAFNLLWWWDLGGTIERTQGGLRLAGLFVVLNVVSNLAQFLSSGSNFGGLSGVVYGLLGYLWMFGKCCPAFPGRINPFIMRFMVGWLLVCMTGIVGPIANAAHVGGLVSGCVLGAVWGWADRRLWG
jgi:GlpG protein